MKKGILHGILAYGSWGLFPIFWKQLQSVDALQIIGHRIVWSFFVVSGLLLLLTKVSRKELIPSRNVLLVYVVASLLIGVNWLLYVWAVNSGHIVESSLGYFINPLFSVLFGIFFFGEKLRKLQILALLLATAGVVYLSLTVGSVPWIALSLALSFGLYGVVKKKASLPPLHGLLLETGLLFIPAVAYLLFREANQTAAFLHGSAKTNMLLLACGAITTFPLVFFASAAQKIPLSLLGFLQYLSPTLQFLTGVLLYQEPFSQERFAGFGLVWVALGVFAWDGRQHRKPKA
jgi:chloramphenicol-sensitive protein RarD